MKVYEIEGYEQFIKKIEELLETVGEDDKIVIFFSGSRNSEGVSWCPDCVKAEPVVEEVIKKYKSNDEIHFLHVGVGEKEFWKNPECVFRTDPKLHLTSVPTLLRWNGEQRLTEEECWDEDLIELVFED